MQVQDITGDPKITQLEANDNEAIRCPGMLRDAAIALLEDELCRPLAFSGGGCLSSYLQRQCNEHNVTGGKDDGIACETYNIVARSCRLRLYLQSSSWARKALRGCLCYTYPMQPHLDSTLPMMFAPHCFKGPM